VEKFRSMPLDIITKL